MKNLLAKTLFISLLLSAAILPGVQAGEKFGLMRGMACAFTRAAAAAAAVALLETSKIADQKIRIKAIDANKTADMAFESLYFMESVGNITSGEVNEFILAWQQILHEK